MISDGSVNLRSKIIHAPTQFLVFYVPLLCREIMYGNFFDEQVCNVIPKYFCDNFLKNSSHPTWYLFGFAAVLLPS